MLRFHNPGNEFVTLPALNIYSDSGSRNIILPLNEEVTEVKPKGYLSQGFDYAFDGSEVLHCEISGDIYPPEFRTLYGVFQITGDPVDRTSSILFKEGVNFYQRLNGRWWVAIHGQFEHEYGTVYWDYTSGNWTDVDDKPNIIVNSAFIHFVCIDKKSRLMSYSQTTLRFPALAKRREKTYRELVDLLNQKIQQLKGTITVSKPRSGLRYYIFGCSVIDPDFLMPLIQGEAEPLGRRIAKIRPHRAIYNSLEGDLAKTCVEGQKAFQGNLLNWADKLTSWGGEVTSSLSMIADPRNPKQWASTWLSYRFGSRLEYNTSMELLDSVWDRLLTIRVATKYDGFNVSRAKKSYNDPAGHSAVCRMRLVCANESLSTLMTAIKKFMDWGAWPSLTNTFDLIPLSFVLDWLGDISTILENVDALVYKQYLKVVLCEKSILWTCDASKALRTLDPFANIDLKLEVFDRWATTTVPDFAVLGGWDPSTPSPIHFVDGVTLLLQLF